MADMVRLDESTKRHLAALAKREKEMGRPALNDTRLINWLADEGAKALCLSSVKVSR